MKEKKRGGALRRVLSLLLALTLLTLCGEMAPEAQAAEKTLSITPGHYIRWRRGLPPQDGNWYRIMLVTTWPYEKEEYIMRGDTLAEYAGSKNARTVITKESGKALLKNSAPSFDPSMDVNYTLNYANTPAIRFAKYDSINGHDSPPPMYYFRLSDWEGDDGKLTDIGLVTSGFDTDLSVPWAFVTREYDEDVSQDCVVIEQFRSSGFFGKSYTLTSRTDYDITPEGKTFISDEDKTPAYSFYVDYIGFSSSTNALYYLYYADEVAIDTIADGQTIEDGEIVNISGKSYLTLAKDTTLTVKDGGILSIGSGLYNDGTIRVEKGGTLLVKQDAFIMPWQTGQRTGNIVCDGGDVIVYSGGRVICEGPSGFKYTGSSGRYGTVYNYGAIITSAFTAAGKARSFHNEGAVMLGYTVKARSAQSFREGELTIASGRAAVAGLKTGKINVDQVTDGVITGNGVVRP